MREDHAKLLASAKTTLELESKALISASARLGANFVDAAHHRLPIERKAEA